GDCGLGGRETACGHPEREQQEHPDGGNGGLDAGRAAPLVGNPFSGGHGAGRSTAPTADLSTVRSMPGTSDKTWPTTLTRRTPPPGARSAVTAVGANTFPAVRRRKSWAAVRAAPGS